MNPRGNVRKRITAFRCRLKRQRDGEVRPLGEVFRLGEEVVDDVRERGVRWTEAGGEEVAERAGDLGGDDGGIIVMSPAATGEIVAVAKRTGRSARAALLGELRQPRDQLVAGVGPHDPLARGGQILRIGDPFHHLRHARCGL